MAQDFYQTLGVTRDASEKEISSAYRRLARQYHPDVTGGDKDAEQRFKQVNANLHFFTPYEDGWVKTPMMPMD